MSVSSEMAFFIDANRCIGCQACVQACSECDTHKGHSMIHLETIHRAESTQTVPVVCMHCDSPTCAEVCPADAIKRTSDGVVQSAKKPRCIACNNCVLSCPFGVPKMETKFELMMKCDMCYDRTSVGKKPMCATVCPSQALTFGLKHEIILERQSSTPVNEFKFGGQLIKTKVYMMAPKTTTKNYIDVTASMNDKTFGNNLEDHLDDVSLDFLEI